MLSQDEKDLCIKLRDIIIALEKAKALYKEKDRIAEILKDKSGLDLANEGILKVDVFEKKNTAWKNTAMSRWDFQVLNLNKD